MSLEQFLLLIPLRILQNFTELLNQKRLKQLIRNKRLRSFAMLLCILLSSCTSEIELAELTIKIRDCRESNYFTYLEVVKILKDNREFKIIKPEVENEYVLENLKYGTYTIIYKSIFEKVETLKVELNENKKYSINLCTNYLDYSKETYKAIIDQLQINESYSIIMESNGCFHSNDDTLTINRNKKDYSIVWRTKTKILSKSNIDALRHFEIELNYMNIGGCTTTDEYIINYNGIKKHILDGTCQWRGYDYLKKQIFN